MTNDPMDDFNRLFDVPDHVDGLSKKIDSLEKHLMQSDPLVVAKTVWDSLNNASEKYLKPAIGVAGDVRSAAARFDDAGKVRLVLRRKLFTAGATVVLLAVFSSGLLLGSSPSLTSIIVGTESGCQWLGGKLMGARDAQTSFCAFEIGRLPHRS